MTMHHVINLTTTQVVAAFASIDAANACAEQFIRISPDFLFIVSGIPSGPVIPDWYAAGYRELALNAAVAEEREACAHVATSFLVGDPANGVPLRNPMAHEIAERIRARAALTSDAQEVNR